MKSNQLEQVKLDKIVGGGQALGELESGKKAFIWGGLPGEIITARITKKKSKLVEGSVTEVIEASDQRIAALEPNSYLSTSPWQIMNFEAEQHYKAALIEEAFELHDIVLPDVIDIYSDNQIYNYRNKVEFSWFGDTIEANEETLDLAFFRRGSKGKVVVNGTMLAREPINILAREIRDLLVMKKITGRSLKTVLIRCDQSGNCVWQLYVKDKLKDVFTAKEAENLSAQGGEIIFSEPKSPASVITKRLNHFGDTNLTDEVLGLRFNYAAESFFQVNIPVYEQALKDMSKWVSGEVLDLYSGVGSIGLTIGGDRVTLVELNPEAVREMKRNVKALGRESSTEIISAASEKALDSITSDKTIIVDPPRAGLHKDVIDRLLETTPKRILYLSCNPVTQARDVALLAEKYGVKTHRGYNFFPRTPHIEHLIVLDLVQD